MRKFTFLLIAVFMAFGFSGWADNWIEDFDTGLAGSYTTGIQSLTTGDWYTVQVFQEESSRSFGGTGHAARINDDKPNASLRTPALNTIGTVTFQYRGYSSGVSSTFIVQKSYNNIDWTQLTTQEFSSTTYAEFTMDVNDDASTVYIRVFNDNQSNHLIVDNFQVTSYSASSPVITLSTSTLNDFSYIYDNGPSLEQSFTVEGNNLTDDIILTAPTNYEISETSGTGFLSPITLTQSGGTVSSTTIYTRLKAGLNVGDYNSEDISISSTNAASKTVTCSGAVIKGEPTNHVTGFSATANGSATIDLVWTENDGAIVPDGYLIKANIGTVVDPVDGTDPPDDTDLTDGLGSMEVAHGVTSYSFTNCSSSTTYNFKIYPFTNSGSEIDFKIDGTVPSSFATTGGPAPEPALGDLVINEVNSTSTANATYVEIYNKTASELSLEKVNLEFYNNGATTASSTVELTGVISANGYIVIARSISSFNSAYGFDPDFTMSGLYLNGGADGLILRHDDNGIFDQYNEAPNGTTSMSDNHLYYRFDYTSDGTSLADDWDDAGLTKNGTPKAKNEITWLTTGTDDWGTENNWSNGDEPSRGVDVIIPSGGTQPVCDGTEANPEQCYYLTINTGAILTIKVGGFLTINRTVTNSTGASGLVVESDNTGNGSLISEDGVTATVKRYFNQYTNSADGWHYIGSPVDDITVTGSDFDPTGTSNDLYSWDEVEYYWRSYQGGNFGGTTLENGMGYMVAYAAEVTNSFTGTLNSTDVSFSNLTKTTGKGDGWHLLGNPYASALKWNDGNWTLTNIGGVAKVYDESEGNYVDINANTNYIIPSTNGFFVQVSSATNSITIPAAARTHDDANNYKNSRAEMDETLQLLVNNDANNFSDKTNIGFRDDAEMSFDWDFDSHKMFGQSTAPQLWTLVDGENYSTNNLPPVFENMELPLNFKAGVTSTYHILAEGLESFYVNSEIYLEDKQLDVTINLREEPMYTFNGQPSDDNARFVLHFFGVTNVNDIYDSEKVIIYGSENTIFIKTEEVNKQYSIEVYDIMGRKLLSDTFSSTGLNTFKLSANAGVYIVKLQSAYGTHIEKINLR